MSDPAARATVLHLVDEMEADGTDAGPIANARYTELRTGAYLLREPPP